MLQTNTEKNVPLRIGVDGRVMQEAKPSGIPQYTINTLREILRIDKKNKYIIFYNYFRDIEKNIPSFEGNVESKIYHFPNKILELVWKMFPYPKIDKLLGVDIFFSPHFINIPLSKKVKKVLTIHDLSFVRNKKYFSWRKNIWHWQMSPKKFCNNSDRIIAVSSATKKDIEKIYKIPAQKIKVVHNGFFNITGDFMENKDQDFLGKFRLQKKKYVLFLATLEPRKNIEGIIEAFAIIRNDIPNHKLVIAGKKGWLFEEIFSKVKKYKLEEDIIFTDFVSEEEKYILFKNSSLFVFPSFCEGFGLPVIEARSHSIPIITSATSSMPEISKDAAILINPHNISDIAESIKNILNNNTLSDIFIEKGANLPTHSWTQTASETLEYLLS